MGFLGNVGQRYLERKTYAAPQQLEHLVKKRLKTAKGGERQIGQPPITVPANGRRDEEIASLQKQLAEVKAEKPAKADSERIYEIPTAAADATNLRRNSRLSSTMETENRGLKEGHKRGRRHSTANSKVVIDKRETFAEASSHRRPSIDTHNQVYKGATVSRRHSQIEDRKVGSRHVQIATSTRQERPIEGRQPEVYAIYVEEEPAPSRRRASSQDVIEVSSGSGRTVYRVR